MADDDHLAWNTCNVFFTAFIVHGRHYSHTVLKGPSLLLSS